MITAPAPTRSPAVTPEQLAASVAALADRAANAGRDTAAGLLQGILREMRAGSRAGT